MGLFDNKSVLKRFMVAVDAELGSDEAAQVVVYARARVDAAAAVVFGTLALAATPTYVIALTQRRVLVFQGNNVNAAKSMLIGTVDRGLARADAVNKSDAPDQIGLVVTGQPTVFFEIPKLWRRDAARLVDELAG